jgi:hypothetical protein
MQRPTGGLDGISDLLKRAKVRKYEHQVCNWGSLTGVRFSMPAIRLTCQRTLQRTLLIASLDYLGAQIQLYQKVRWFLRRLIAFWSRSIDCSKADCRNSGSLDSTIYFLISISLLCFLLTCNSASGCVGLGLSHPQGHQCCSGWLQPGWQDLCHQQVASKRSS